MNHQGEIYQHIARTMKHFLAIISLPQASARIASADKHSETGGMLCGIKMKNYSLGVNIMILTLPGTLAIVTKQAVVVTTKLEVATKLVVAVAVATKLMVMM